MSGGDLVGVFGTSQKENERRVPIYPDHVPWIEPTLRARLVFQLGYGARFGFRDEFFLSQGCSVATRDELFGRCRILLLPKPTVADIESMVEGQVLCGWVHCVQQHAVTQSAIDRRVTILAWESMHHWDGAGNRLLHIFYKNNELAGYAAVLHVLQLTGIDGHYGPRRRVTVTGYGAVSRGAIYALQGRGFNYIHVVTLRPTHLVADQNPDVYYAQYVVPPDGRVIQRSQSGEVRPFIEEIAESDIICNGIIQDTDSPTIFVHADEVNRLKARSIVVDVSCDEGMGFCFARPTSFEAPTFEVGDKVTYYSVDHTPSYLWNAASREISRALLPYLPIIADRRCEWERDRTVSNAVEVEHGEIRNRRILRFQGRTAEFPHAYISSGMPQR